MTQENNTMQVEIWSDIMCPFCYIGKRNLESALRDFADRDNIQIVWKSFQLDPSIPEHMDSHESVYQYLSKRKGIPYERSVKMHEGLVTTAHNAGLEYNFDKAIVANSFNAHRIIQFAKTKGLGDKAEERFFLAYFTQGKDLGDQSTLLGLAQEIGLTLEEANEAISNDLYAGKVEEDIAEAGDLGINSVPFFVFNRRYAVSGAQPPAAFLQALETSYGEWQAE